MSGTASVHLQGMGIVGSLLAHALGRNGIPFTWNDTEEEVCAWRASTAIVYPPGPDDAEGLAGIAGWRRWWLTELNRHMKPVPYVFEHAQPPHGARIGWTALEARPWKLAEARAVAVSAQTLVEETRLRFFRRRLDESVSRDDVITIVSHGYGPRLDHYTRGWSRQVRLAMPAGVPADAALIGRTGFPNRAPAYAYPVAGRAGWHWAGSSMVRCNRAEPADHQREWSDWLEHFDDLGVEVIAQDEFREGWRPVPAKDDRELARWIGPELHVRPMSHSGVRLAPLYTAAVIRELEERLS